MISNKSFKWEIEVINGELNNWYHNKKKYVWVNTNIRFHSNPKNIRLYDKKNKD